MYEECPLVIITISDSFANSLGYYRRRMGSLSFSDRFWLVLHSGGRLPNSPKYLVMLHILHKVLHPEEVTLDS